ncbi:MAG: superoxide dismutase family protein, partial [Alphaproteobacteria bacterium]|nr:superoxide dismutase family protein [Alphaproteobacteria bacterium]
QEATSQNEEQEATSQNEAPEASAKTEMTAQPEAPEASSILHESASAELKNTDGAVVGTVMFEALPHGTLLKVELDGVPAGTHAFHVHAIGACEPPFTSAGGHFNPDGKKHGLRAEQGPHKGDFPNIHVPESAQLEIEYFNPALALNEALFDEDGAAVVIHEGPDDYATDPAGAAGPRIACGVITP